MDTASRTDDDPRRFDDNEQSAKYRKRLFDDQEHNAKYRKASKRPRRERKTIAASSTTVDKARAIYAGGNARVHIGDVYNYGPQLPPTTNDAMFNFHANTLIKILQELRNRRQPSGSPHNDRASDIELIHSIERLCELVHEKERTINVYTNDDDQADSIIRDVQVILESARKQESTVRQMPATLPAQRDSKVIDKEYSRSLRRFGRAFGVVELAINQGARGKKYPTGIIIRQRCTHHKIRVSVGTLTFMNNKRTRISRISQDDRREQNSGQTDYTMTISFLPDDLRRFHMLVASAHQQEIFRGTVSSISRLEVNRVLPAGSRVFRLVKEGRLRKLQEMLRRGEASLRDHDEYGASLLFYSTQQPEMCKFLIEHGLDVDKVGGVMGTQPYLSKNYFMYALQIECNDEEMESGKLSRVNRSRRLLLEAGADPTIRPNSDASAFIEAAVVGGDLEAIRLAWDPDLVGHFARINEPVDEWGQPPLLIACENYGAGYNKEIFALLLDLGADTHVRDSTGGTCLHICLRRSGYSNCFDGGWPIRQYNALKFLVERGADPNSVDNNGRTVSHFAYAKSPSFFHKRRDIGSYHGDLWDSVLQSCGYDIAEFRVGQPRKAKYTERYTRRHFEALWHGREHLCPYWDDSRWPTLNIGEIDAEESYTDSDETLDSWSGELDSEGDGDAMAGEDEGYDEDEDSSESETNEGNYLDVAIEDFDSGD